MKRLFIYILISLPVFAASAQQVKSFSFGNFEQWMVRQIQESSILGGQLKTLYEIAPKDTLLGNKPFQASRYGSPWSTSNTYAHVMGVDKAMVSVEPAPHGSGRCACLTTRLQKFTVMGAELNALTPGTIFTGQMYEPTDLKSCDHPMKMLNVGIPFTQTPSAMLVDYKAAIENSTDLVEANGGRKVTHLQGRDGAEIIVLLQRRWEDANGQIHAERVGTGWLRVNSSTSWQNGTRIPIRKGDITKQAGYHSYEGLMTDRFMARNKQGKMVYIHEEGYSDAAPTHLIIFISSSCQKPFVGHVGNTLWVDNIRLEYAQ